MRITIINGPNLNLLGRREPSIYGTKSMEQVLVDIQRAYPDVHFEYRQSNHEGDLIDWVQSYGLVSLESACLQAVDGRSATPVDGRTPQSLCDSSPINKGAEELKGGGVFDLVFIDADKKEYCDYLDLVLPLMQPGGWILADNTLWDGHIIDPAYDKDRQTVALRAFNDKVAQDPRLEKVILPLRDGLTIIRVK